MEKWFRFHQTWQINFEFNVLQRPIVDFAQGLATLTRDGEGRGVQEFQIPCTSNQYIYERKKLIIVSELETKIFRKNQKVS